MVLCFSTSTRNQTRSPSVCFINQRSTPSLGDGIDYAQQRRECLGELVDETLQALEAHGGPDAFVNIKHLVPTYESSYTGGRQGR
jgi:hypothetical protein